MSFLCFPSSLQNRLLNQNIDNKLLNHSKTHQFLTYLPILNDYGHKDNETTNNKRHIVVEISHQVVGIVLHIGNSREKYFHIHFGNEINQNHQNAHKSHYQGDCLIFGQFLFEQKNAE